MQHLILDLCGGTGAWSKPYHDTGYAVRVVDPVQYYKSDYKTICYISENVEQFYQYLYDNPQIADDVHGILAAPPCTEFAVSGARWWKDKPPELLREAMYTVDACLDIIALCNPKWWVMENPVSRLPRLYPNKLGKPRHYFQPWEYGDPYTKKTCLWGDFVMPPKTPVEPTEGGKIHRMAPSPDRARLRSITPPGFANAFFKSNP